MPNGKHSHCQLESNEPSNLPVFLHGILAVGEMEAMLVVRSIFHRTKDLEKGGMSTAPATISEQVPQPES